jgi:hypothetical protein
MTKRSDTQPMLGRPVPQAEQTDPIPGDQTIPGGPPAMTLPPSTTSIAPPVRPEEAKAASSLLAAFKAQPLAPPAPRPKHQASSEGGDAVAYSTVARPAARSRGEVSDQSLVEIEIARLAALPDALPQPQAAGGRHDPTVLVTLRRRPGGWVRLLVGVAGVVSLAAVVAVVLTLAHPTTAARPAPLTSAIAPPSSAPAVDPVPTMAPAVAPLPPAPPSPSGRAPEPPAAVPSSRIPAAASVREPHVEPRAAPRPAASSKSNEQFNW